MRYLVILLIFIAFTVKAGAQAPEQDMDLLRATYYLLVYTQSGDQYFSGSGFVVKGNKGYYLVSAKHVFNNDSTPYINFIEPTYETSNLAVSMFSNYHRDSMIYTQKLLYRNPRQINFKYIKIGEKVIDVAILKLDTVSSLIKKNAFDLITIDTALHENDLDTCYMIGFPLNKKGRYAIETTVLNAGIPDREFFYNVLIPQDMGGASGSPILIRKGEFVKVGGVFVGERKLGANVPSLGIVVPGMYLLGLILMEENKTAAN